MVWLIPAMMFGSASDLNFRQLLTLVKLQAVALNDFDIDKSDTQVGETYCQQSRRE